MTLSSKMPSTETQQVELSKVKSYLINNVTQAFETNPPPYKQRHQAAVQLLDELYKRTNLDLAPTLREQLFRDVLDDLLTDYVENHKSFKHMSKKESEALAKRIICLVDYSEYKRRQAPIGIKITTRAFGRDWRLPITNRYKEF